MKPLPSLRRPRHPRRGPRVLCRGAGAKVLAGGQSLLPLLSMRLAAPATLVDINRVPGLDPSRTTTDGVRWARSSGTTHCCRRRRRPGPAAAGPGDGERRPPGDPQPGHDGRLHRARRPLGRDDLGPRPDRRLRRRRHARRRRDGRLARPVRRPAGDLDPRSRGRHLRLLPRAAGRARAPPSPRSPAARATTRSAAPASSSRWTTTAASPPSAPPTSRWGWSPRCTT